LDTVGGCDEAGFEEEEVSNAKNPCLRPPGTAEVPYRLGRGTSSKLKRLLLGTVVVEDDGGGMGTSTKSPKSSEGAEKSPKPDLEAEEVGLWEDDVDV
jgi:hypothetical protein